MAWSLSDALSRPNELREARRTNGLIKASRTNCEMVIDLPTSNRRRGVVPDHSAVVAQGLPRNKDESPIIRTLGTQNVRLGVD